MKVSILPILAIQALHTVHEFDLSSYWQQFIFHHPSGQRHISSLQSTKNHWLWNAVSLFSFSVGPVIVSNISSNLEELFFTVPWSRPFLYVTVRQL